MMLARGRLALALYVSLCCLACSPSPKTAKVTQVMIDFKASPLPLEPIGLSFQMGTQMEGATRPLQSALLTADGSVFLGFPQQNILMSFSPPNWETQFYGHVDKGGKGVDLPPAAQLGGTESHLVVMDEGNFKAVSLSPADGTTAETLEVPPGAQLLPSGQFLSVVDSPGRSVSISWQVSAFENTTRSWYQFPNEHDSKDSLFSLDGRGFLARLNPQTGILEVAGPNSSSRIVWQIPTKTAAGNLLSITDFAYVANRFWLMVQEGNHPSVSQVLVLDERATIRSYWSLPYAADRFAVGHDQVLFYHRAEARAQMYRL